VGAARLHILSRSCWAVVSGKKEISFLAGGNSGLSLAPRDPLLLSARQTGAPSRLIAMLLTTKLSWALG
jgi:hypothetical protein